MPIIYLEKRGNLKGFSEGQKIDFVETCKSHFHFYDPYKDLFINPITSKTYWPKTLQRLFLHSKASLEKKLSSNLPTHAEVEKGLEILYSRKKRAYVLLSIIRFFKYLGFIAGGLLAYFVDIKLGLAAGLYLIYFDYNTFDGVNGVIGQIQTTFMTALLWRQKRKLYFFGSLIILILSLVNLYFYADSIWLVVGIFITQKWLLVNPLIQFITSAAFRGSEIAIQLKEEYESFRFSQENPKGIKNKRN